MEFGKQLFIVDGLPQDFADRLIQWNVVVSRQIKNLQSVMPHTRHPCQGKAVDPLGHYDIRDEKIERLLVFENLQCFAKIRSVLDDEAGRRKSFSARVAESVVVIHEKDSLRHFDHLAPTST